MFNFFILCYYIVFHVNNNITYNDKSNILLNINLSMLFVDINKVICYKLRLNCNDIKVNMT